MPNMIDWYVVELRLLLNGKLPPGRVDEVVKEAEAHLRESVQRRLGPTVDENAATAAAIEAYGRPEKVALGFLRGSRRNMWGLNPVWWAALGAVIAIYCWTFHWQTLGGYFDNFGETWQNVVAGLVGVLGLALVVFAVRAGFRSYRLALTGLTFAAAALSIPAYVDLDGPGTRL
ncbi:MAG: HAAS signaling domain-containing protein [Fimbriimonadales bacterium]